MKPLKPHPSGRPIRRRDQREPSIWRIPDDGPVTPRLRCRELASAIGFHHQYVERDPNEDEQGD